ncbi:hypothetical protein SOVF_045220 [Spinacia oleracea]|nr:hypothetical protein SOVF_045220 [Spinacia oleracea]
MGRAPCCEKMGLKKGPWTPDEDELLINYINLHGHTNWRALPKLAAAKLPGRTDNEIKNVWHTHLKKRLPKQETDSTTTTTTATTASTGITVVPTKKRARKFKSIKKDGAVSEGPPPKKQHVNNHNNGSNINSNNNDIKTEDDSIPTTTTSSINCNPVSPQPCTSTSEESTITSSTSVSESDNCSKENVVKKEGYVGEFPEFNDDFWMEVLSVEEDTAMSNEDLHYMSNSAVTEPVFLQDSKVSIHGDDMDCFWYNLLTRPDDQLPEFSEML